MILGIETATNVCSVALADESGLVGEININRKNSHSEILFENIDVILKSSGVKTNQLNGIAVSNGPGSFTGLRIGLAAAKGLSLGWNLPIMGILTLDGVIAGKPPLCETACVLISARKAEFYLKTYKYSSGQWISDVEIKLLVLDELAANLPPGKKILLGNGAVFYKNEIQNRVKETLWLAANNSGVSGYGIAVEGLKRLKNNDIDDVNTLTPKYFNRYKGVE